MGMYIHFKIFDAEARPVVGDFKGYICFYPFLYVFFPLYYLVFLFIFS